MCDECSYSDEVEAVLAVYGDKIEVNTVPSETRGNGNLEVVYTNDACCTKFVLPEGYPGNERLTYTINLKQSSPKNKSILRGVIPDIEQVLEDSNGEETLFLLLDIIRRFEEKHEEMTETQSGTSLSCEENFAECVVFKGFQYDHGAPVVASTCSLDIYHGDIIEERKSKFQAHFAKVNSVEEVISFKRAICEDSKCSKATHNIFAYRFLCPERNILVHDYDDDGENAAGGRLAEMLRLAKVEGVAVIVVRKFLLIYLCFSMI